MLEVRYRKGVELPGLGLWLDPAKRQALAFVSHAHSDHLGAHAEVLLTEATAVLMRARIGGRRAERRVAFGAATELNGAVARLLPAGHITGSAQLHLETEAGSLLYTGDFKLRASRSAAEATPTSATEDAESPTPQTRGGAFGLKAERAQPFLGAAMGLGAAMVHSFTA